MTREILDDQGQNFNKNLTQQHLPKNNASHISKQQQYNIQQYKYDKNGNSIEYKVLPLEEMSILLSCSTCCKG